MGQNKVGVGGSPGVTAAVGFSTLKLGLGYVWESAEESFELTNGMNWEWLDLTAVFGSVLMGLVLMGLVLDSWYAQPTSNKHRKKVM